MNPSFTIYMYKADLSGSVVCLFSSRLGYTLEYMITITSLVKYEITINISNPVWKQVHK